LDHAQARDGEFELDFEFGLLEDVSCTRLRAERRVEEVMEM
jgi:hypothetical protein